MKRIILVFVFAGPVGQVVASDVAGAEARGGAAAELSAAGASDGAVV